MQDVEHCDSFARDTVKYEVVAVRALADAARLIAPDEREAARQFGKRMTFLPELGDEGPCPCRIVERDVVANDFKIVLGLVGKSDDQRPASAMA